MPWMEQCRRNSEPCHHSLTFILNNNELTGRIPSQLGKISTLHTFDVNRNDLTGTIPSQLGTLSSSLVNLFLDNKKLTVQVPSELGNISTLQNLFLCVNLDLTGTIPPEINQTQVDVRHSGAQIQSWLEWDKSNSSGCWISLTIYKYCMFHCPTAPSLISNRQHGTIMMLKDRGSGQTAAANIRSEAAPHRRTMATAALKAHGSLSSLQKRGWR